MAGETDFIDWLSKGQCPSQRVPIPVGDDLAVLRWSSADLLLVGVDQVLDGVHFESSRHSPRAIGKKVMNRNLSDCAAMACLPAGAVTTAALPRGCGLDYAKELYLGLREAADQFDCPIVGGDTASWAGPLALTVTILGRSAGITPVTRAGARPGDSLYVSGPLGGSLLGRHMTFQPQINLARDLARSSRITAMIDLSDGLARDVTSICRSSGVGAELAADAIPIHDDARRAAAADPHPGPLSRALGDGEDYELLLSSPDDLRRFGLFAIGKIVEGSQPLLRNGPRLEPLPVSGWEHAL